MQNYRGLFLIAFPVLAVMVVIIGAFFYQYRQLQILEKKVVAVEHAAQENSVPTLSARNSGVNLEETAPASSSSEQITQLQTQIKDLSDRLAKVEKKLGMVKVTAQKTSPEVKEYIIYLGAGQTDNRDWTDISSAVATINTGNYGQLKAVYFEAGLSIIGGEAHARLKNQTTGEVMYQTEVFNNTSASDWKTSAAFPLSSGQNAYGVQLRSTSGEMAVLNGSRLHLFLQ